MPKEIELTQGYVAIVDDEDYERASQYSWRAMPRDNGDVYALRLTKERKNQFLHHFILNTTKMCDHKDRNALNNQKDNLRICTHQQNCANRGPRQNFLGYKGVTLIRSGRFMARIKGKSLGTFDTPEEAARAFDKYAYEQDGEFAYLNFPLHEEAGD